MGASCEILASKSSRTGWARGEREGYGGPRDVTSLSLSKHSDERRPLVLAPQQEKIHMLTLPHPYLAARSAFAGTQLYPSSSSHMTS